MIRRKLASACAFALLLYSVAFSAPLPTRLSDTEFWRMVSTFSEENGYFRFENFLSNELEYQSVIPALKETTRPGGVYLGVGPEQNFTYIAALQPKAAFIFDIRRQNMLELLMYKAVFELSTDRADFLSQLFSRPRPAGLTEKSTVTELFLAYSNSTEDEALFSKNAAAVQKRLLTDHKFNLSKEDLQTIQYVHRVFGRSGTKLDYIAGGGGDATTYAELMSAEDGNGQMRSFLASEENFKRVQEMQRRNLIVPVVGDFAGPKAIRAVAQYLREQNEVVTAFYLSNVEQYLFDQGDAWSDFYSNVATLPVNSNSQFIRASRFAFPTGPRQLQRRPERGNFLSLLSPMEAFIGLFKEGHIENYNQVIQLSR
jgi:hypothetical protein